MAQANTGVEYAVEIGVWVDSDQPKKSGPGMRKVWVAGDAGENTRISVIARADGKTDRHLVTLPIGSPEAADVAAHVLTLALQGVEAYHAHKAQPAPKVAKAPPAPKAPTADAVTKARAALKPAPAPKVTAPAPSAPAAYSAQDWAALLG